MIRRNFYRFFFSFLSLLLRSQEGLIRMLDTILGCFLLVVVGNVLRYKFTFMNSSRIKYLKDSGTLFFRSEIFNQLFGYVSHIPLCIPESWLTQWKKADFELGLAANGLLYSQKSTSAAGWSSAGWAPTGKVEDLVDDSEKDSLAGAKKTYRCKLNFPFSKRHLTGVQKLRVQNLTTAQRRLSKSSIHTYVNK